jgi:acyl-CoA synthetase (AMP-forming)/AMP-acid ligase II
MDPRFRGTTILGVFAITAFCFELSLFSPAMPNPLSLISLAAAARGGAIDGVEARQLVAAGVTLLQRCAPLVLELGMGSGAVLLPNSAHYLAALGACEGRAAILLDPEWESDDIAAVLEANGGRVVFTLERYGGAVRDEIAKVLLDELPGHVAFVHDGRRRRIDVGSHFGLSIEGDEESEGSDEEAIVARERKGEAFRSFTHRELLAGARAALGAGSVGEGDEVMARLPFHEARGLVEGLLAPLLGGARVVTRSKSGGDR